MTGLISDSIADSLFGLQDGPADRVLLAAGRRIGELDPDRLSVIAVAIASDQTVGLAGGLDVTERRRLAERMRAENVDTSDRERVLAWLRRNPGQLAAASRSVAVSRGHVPRGLDLMVRRWTGRDRRPRSKGGAL
jgi:hypothetical protein